MIPTADFTHHKRAINMHRYTFLITMTLLFFGGCASNPATHEHDFVMMSESEELAIGQKVFQQVSQTVPLLPKKDPLAIYVDHVGQKLATISDRPELFYRFFVVDDKTINAFALPGGYIFIHRGLVNHMNSEAELAAVLGHEIGHVTARHAVKQISRARAYQVGMVMTSIFVPIPQSAGMMGNIMATAMIRGYGRDAELQADELSIRYLTRSGYDPHAIIDVLKTLKRLDDIDTLEKKDSGDKVEKYHGAFSTHPETSDRIREAVTKAASLQQQTGITNHNAMLVAVDGYPYADRPEDGVVIGQHFFHPDLGIQLHFPEKWIIHNQPQAVVARVRQKKVFFQMRMIELRKRQSASEILHNTLRTGDAIIDTGTQGGMPYAHTTLEKSAPHVSHAKIDAYIFLQGSRAYLITLWCKRDQFADYQKNFATIAQSFQPYDHKKEGDVPRIALHVWAKDDSWKKLATATKERLGRFTAEKIAALNGMGIDETPKLGEVIKTVK